MLLAMLLVWKLRGWGHINAVAPGRLIYLEDQLSQRHFLVDTGAAYSILLFQSVARPSGPGHKEIPCWEERSVDVMYHGSCFT